MKAIVVHNDGADPQLKWQQVDDISFGDHELLVNVRATAVNRADLSQARGNYPPPPGASQILGLEMAGEIAAVGAEVQDWQVGDRVMALLPGGGYAEQAAVPAAMLMRVPPSWDFATAAAIPEVWLTAYVNLFHEANLSSGETVLLHAGASGVGTAAIQLARSQGAVVYVTAGAEHKLDRCRELGATLAINRKTQQFRQEILAQSDGVDVILDPVGADYLEDNIAVLRRYGRLVHIGLLSGRRATLDLGQVMGKRLKLIGSTLRTRPLAEKIALTAAFAERFLPQLASGQLQPIIDRQFPIEQAQEAHAYVAANKNVGKVILTV